MPQRKLSPRTDDVCSLEGNPDIDIYLELSQVAFNALRFIDQPTLDPWRVCSLSTVQHEKILVDIFKMQGHTKD